MTNLTETAKEILASANSWEADVKLIGNVQARDIARVCEAFIQQQTTMTLEQEINRIYPALCKFEVKLGDHDRCDPPNYYVTQLSEVLPEAEIKAMIAYILSIQRGANENPPV